jgi:hypothetical protein
MGNCARRESVSNYQCSPIIAHHLLMHSNASSNRTGRSDSLREGWIDTGTALLCLVPLLLTTYLPLPDLPDHLARQYILRDWASSPQLQVLSYSAWDAVAAGVPTDLLLTDLRFQRGEPNGLALAFHARSKNPDIA